MTQLDQNLSMETNIGPPSPPIHPSSLPHHVKAVTGTGAVRLQRLTAVASLIILTAIVAPLQFASL